ncbi:hypothetical protein BKA70DRAFT_1400336 [Coprinopsis sp. MPI-PUGE-AT-0042]|nr:hypothetical protein BKA70DRAFT_1400336 [Coprinopsis sp. MPI-PUGE-AT-0042]
MLLLSTTKHETKPRTSEVVSEGNLTKQIQSLFEANLENNQVLHIPVVVLSRRPVSSERAQQNLMLFRVQTQDGQCQGTGTDASEILDLALCMVHPLEALEDRLQWQRKWFKKELSDTRGNQSPRISRSGLESNNRLWWQNDSELLEFHHLPGSLLLKANPKSGSPFEVRPKAGTRGISFYGSAFMGPPSTAFSSPKTGLYGTMNTQTQSMRP